MTATNLALKGAHTGPFVARSSARIPSSSCRAAIAVGRCRGERSKLSPPCPIRCRASQSRSRGGGCRWPSDRSCSVPRPARGIGWYRKGRAGTSRFPRRRSRTCFQTNRVRRVSTEWKRALRKTPEYVGYALHPSDPNRVILLQVYGACRCLPRSLTWSVRCRG